MSEKAEELLFEFAERQLEVVLIPAPDARHCGHYVRAVANQNPRWYQKFCALYPSSRRGTKTRAAIKRRETIKALENLAAGRIVGIYGERLLDFIERECFKPAPPAYKPPREYHWLDSAF